MNSLADCNKVTFDRQRYKFIGAVTQSVYASPEKEEKQIFNLNSVSTISTKYKIFLNNIFKHICR